MNKQEILELIEEEDVEFIRLQFVDAFGNLKNLAVTPDRFERVIDNKYQFDGSAFFDGQYDYNEDLEDDMEGSDFDYDENDDDFDYDENDFDDSDFDEEEEPDILEELNEFDDLDDDDFGNPPASKPKRGRR